MTTKAFHTHFKHLLVYRDISFAQWLRHRTSVRNVKTLTKPAVSKKEESNKGQWHWSWCSVVWWSMNKMPADTGGLLSPALPGSRYWNLLARHTLGCTIRPAVLQCDGDGSRRPPDRGGFYNTPCARVRNTQTATKVPNSLKKHKKQQGS